MRWSARLQLALLAATVVVWLLLVSRSELWLPATLLAYGPRLVVLLPFALVLPVGLLFARRSLLFTACAALLAVSQIMGYRMSLAPAEPPMRLEASEESTLRVLSLNVAGRVDATRLQTLFVRYEPDVVSLQECPRQLIVSLATIEGWHIGVFHGLCTVGRLAPWTPCLAPSSHAFGSSVTAARLWCHGI